MSWDRIWDIDPTLIGPYELPWHALFIVIEVAALVFALYQWRKNGKLTFNDLFWLVAAAGVHAFYAIRLHDATPDFELEIRYYGLFFAIGLLGGARAFPDYFERWGFPRKHGEALTLWTPIAMLLGAHFVHLIFYETESILNNPIRIIQLGSGLASHGGGLGAILAVLFFARRHKVDALSYMDAGMCGATWVIPWVRVGNFFNSEIVGRAWDGPWAIAFPRHDCRELGFSELADRGAEGLFCVATRDGEIVAERIMEPLFRHPSQVYEAVLGFLMLGIAIYLKNKWANRLRPGAVLFILLAYYFTTRFFIEYTKEYQTLADSFPLTMGQCLSLPIVLVSLYMLLFSKKSNIVKPYTPEPVTAAGPSSDDDAPPVSKPRRKKALGAKASERAADAPEPNDEPSGDTSPPRTSPSKPKKRKKRK